MAHFSEINEVPPPYPMLQHIARVAKPKLAPMNNIDNWGEECWSDNLCEVLQVYGGPLLPTSI